MINAEFLLEAIVDKWKATTALVAELESNPENIFAFVPSFPDKTDYTEAIKTLKRGQVMVAWRGTRTGQFGNLDAIKHDFSAAFRPIGKPFEVWRLMREGVPGVGDGQKFKNTLVHHAVHCPEEMACRPQTLFVSETAIEYFEVTLTLTERGVDN